MKKLLLAVAAIMLLGPYAVQAAETQTENCFSWTHNLNDNATHYKIYRDPSTDVQFVFPDFARNQVCPDPDNADRCKACVPKLNDGKNHRFVATAYNDVTKQESDFSKHADVFYDGEKTTVEPIEQGPISPGDQFILTIPVTIQKVMK